MDNALDIAGDCEFGELPAGVGFFVEDAGHGIDGGERGVANLFSIRRSLTSTKRSRRPTRGALGNGLRVVTGAVLASGGSIMVHTRRQQYYLIPQHSGETQITAIGNSDVDGTRIEVTFGPELTSLPDHVFAWASIAQMMARAEKQKPSAEKPSLHWHDEDSFAGLLRDVGHEETVRQFLQKFDGFSGNRASEVAGEFLGKRCNELSRGDAAKLFREAVRAVERPSHNALGRVGPLRGWQRSKNSSIDGYVRVGHANIPYRIEVWVRAARKPSATICINRTPTPAEVELDLSIQDGAPAWTVAGAGLHHWFERKGKKNFEVLVNIQCPKMPLTSDGKSPDLLPAVDELCQLLKSAADMVGRQTTNKVTGAGTAKTIKSVILGNLHQAIHIASHGGRNRYSQRRLFYAIRPTYQREFDGAEPNWQTFTAILRQHERQEGHDLPGIYRDNRGVLIHPHSRKEVALGTLNVELYERPKWALNKILYVEKGGPVPMLLDSGWPEKWDCGIATSQGFASDAVKDLLAALEESDEPLLILCAHDSDGFGTTIFDDLVAGASAACWSNNRCCGSRPQP